MRLLPLVFALLAAAPLFAQGPAAGNQAAVVAFAQKAATHALNFHEGDLQGLESARADFTPGAWNEFLKHMAGFLDPKGAPTFTSSFVPSADPVILGEENGLVHLRIPGTLKQTQGHSSTTYRAALDIQAGGKPVKLRHLEQITCPGQSTTCQ